MAIASAAAAIGQSRAIVSALDAIGRQPSAAGRIQVAMIIGLALIESLAIYVLLIALIIFFCEPLHQVRGPRPIDDVGASAT
ncbi:MAG TPA: ATP synthase F0 subunit C [Candidatus Methylomirabilis sp.]|nr:ATP synthase F0 subunit C [Candidatus Methylomirabilis sp.]